MNRPGSPICRILSGLTCAIVLSGCRPSTQGESGAAALSSNPPTTPVKLAVVEAKQFNRTIVQPATIHAYYQTAIYSRARGFVSELHTDIGDRVKPGQLLAKIDVPELESELQSHEARLELLRAQTEQILAEIDAMTANILASQSLVEQAEAEISQADAILAAASAEHQRISELVQRGAVQARLLDESKQRLEAAEAGCQAAAGSVQTARTGIDVAKANKVVTEAKLRAAEAELRVVAHQRDTLQTAIRFATIEAPFEATVSQRHVHLGDLIRGETMSEQKPLFVLSQTDRVRIQVAIPERDAPFVHIDSPLSLSFPSFADEPPLVTVVTRRSGDIDPATRTMLIEAEVENPDGKLMPGMFGEARIEIGGESATNVLPATAVRFDEAGNAFVYRVTDESRVEIVDVTLGLDTGTEIEVISGLEAGQRVVDAHLKRFTDGLLVKPL